MIITKKAPYKLWKGDQEIKTSVLPCVSRVGSSTIIVMTRIADCFRHDYELIINKKNSVKVSQSFLYSLVGRGRGGRRPLAHSKILLKTSEVVVPHGSRFETDV